MTAALIGGSGLFGVIHVIYFTCGFYRNPERSEFFRQVETEIRGLSFLDSTLHTIQQEIYRVLDELTRLLHSSDFLPKLRLPHRCHVLRHHKILITLNNDHRIQPLRWPSSEGRQREQWDHHPSGQLANDVALHIQQIGVNVGLALIAVDRELHQNAL